jgi:hypothetical protein
MLLCFDRGGEEEEEGKHQESDHSLVVFVFLSLIPHWTLRERKEGS